MSHSRPNNHGILLDLRLSTGFFVVIRFSSTVVFLFILELFLFHHGVTSTNTMIGTNRTIRLLANSNNGGNDNKEVEGDNVQIGTASVTHKKGQSQSSDGGVEGRDSFWFVPAERCDWVLEHFRMRDDDNNLFQQGDVPPLQERYEVQSESRDSFFRGTSHHFWMDFVQGRWGTKLLESVIMEEDTDYATLNATINAALENQTTWTWITGDQHLSNFGTYHNRKGDIVFAVNDFDEAAIYDFQVDVVRIAVSIVEHTLSTLSLKSSSHSYSPIVHDIVRGFCDTYVSTVLSYVGNHDARSFELTRHTATGLLKDFLKKVEKKNSRKKMIKKYTTPTRTSKVGKREFIKAQPGDTVPNKETKLIGADPRREKEIRHALTSTRYGATMMIENETVPFQWNDDVMEVLDVAQRIGSGVGSYGVERYYVLLQGGGDSNNHDDEYDDEYQQVILDIKLQPKASVEYILTTDESAWYQTLFENSAARTIEGHRRLTSFADPYTGWILLRAPIDASSAIPASDSHANEVTAQLLPFSVRQRSPWKDEPDLNDDDWKDPDDFAEFMRQIALSVATSHARGTDAVKHSKGFKAVVNQLFGETTEHVDKSSERDGGSPRTNAQERRHRWTETIVQLAVAYHEQLELDYGCFKSYITSHAVEESESEGGD